MDNIKDCRFYKNQKIIFVITAVILLLYAIGRSFFGLYWSDETYVMSEIYDFSLGQKMISDTQSSIQFLTKILSPVMLFYVKVVGSAEGVILFFRICYCLVEFALAVFVVRVLRKYYGIMTGALGFSVVMIFAPLTFNNFSYHNVALLCLWAECACLFSLIKDSTNISYCKLCFAGIITSIMTVAYPPMIGLGVFVFAVILLLCIIRRKRKIGRLLIFIGCWALLPVTLFLIALIEQGSLQTLLQVGTEYLSSRGMLVSGAASEQHIFDQIICYFRDIITFVYQYYPAYPAYPAWFVLYVFIGSAVLFIFRIMIMRVRRMGIFFSPAITVFITIFIIGSAYYNRYSVAGMNYVGCAFLYLFLLLLILTCNKDNNVLAVAFLMPVVIASCIAYCTSNTNMIAGSALMLPCSVPVFILMIQIYNLFPVNWRKTAQGIVWCAIICSLLFLRSGSDYMNHFLPGVNVMSKLTVRLDAGPCKGLFVTEDRARVYNTIMFDLKKDILPGDRIATLNCLPWAFLITDASPAMRYNWAMYGSKDDSAYSLRFYEMNPKQKPDTIIVFDDSADLIPIDWASDEAFSGFMEDYEITTSRVHYNIYREIQ